MDQSLSMFAAGEGYYPDEDINHAVVRILGKARGSQPPGTVLDIGCGRGRLGGEIGRLGYRVTGIDNNPVAQAAARPRLGEVLACNILDFEALRGLLGGRRFDWLVAADVLEHLPDPLAALRFYREFLKPQGRLVVSLPNVAVWDNRLRLLSGRFHYADSGVLDRTHLRFFTFRSAEALLAAAGFATPATTWEPGIVRAFLPLLKPWLRGNGASSGAILESRPYRFYVRYAMPVEHAVCAIAPGLFAFRIVMSAPLAAGPEC